VLDDTNEADGDQQWVVIAPDFKCTEVGHVFYGILPHPGAAGIARCARDVQQNAEFLQRLYDRDVADHATIYLQKSYADASKLTTGEEFTAELRCIG